GVRNAATVVDAHPQQGPRIAGFVVPDGRFDEEALRRALGERLPAYMVPAVLRPVDALPITDNGKLDRAALAALLRDDRSGPMPGASRLEQQRLDGTGPGFENGPAAPTAPASTASA